jgi:hypothetical protein
MRNSKKGRLVQRITSDIQQKQDRELRTDVICIDIDEVSRIIHALETRQSIYGTSDNVKYVFSSGKTQLITSQVTDFGWGCGYRNLQMILSSCGIRIPEISQIQEQIQEAGKRGFDPIGGQHFNNQLIGKNEWIGATEIATYLYSNSIKAFIVDIWKKTHYSGRNSHSLMTKWILDYYTLDLNQTQFFIHETNLPSLYLQYQGHSISIVGIEISIDTNQVLAYWIFDPHLQNFDTELDKLLHSPASAKFRLPVSALTKTQYQIVGISYSSSNCSIVYDSEEETLSRIAGAYQLMRIP